MLLYKKSISMAPHHATLKPHNVLCPKFSINQDKKPIFIKFPLVTIKLYLNNSYSQRNVKISLINF